MNDQHPPPAERPGAAKNQPDPRYAGQKPTRRPLTDREAFEELRRRQIERRRPV